MQMEVARSTPLLDLAPQFHNFLLVSGALTTALEGRRGTLPSFPSEHTQA